MLVISLDDVPVASTGVFDHGQKPVKKAILQKLKLVFNNCQNIARRITGGSIETTEYIAVSAYVLIYIHETGLN